VSSLALPVLFALHVSYLIVQKKQTLNRFRYFIYIERECEMNVILIERLSGRPKVIRVRGWCHI
jgi:hypothetical protein